MTSDPTKLPFPPSVAQLYARAFWDPKPTTTTKSERQLAYALGYPDDWRVERTVEYKDGSPIIRDRIHALFGKRTKSQYTWFHHEAAQAAAAKLESEGTIDESHLLPPTPLYAKGDVVQVHWEGKWYEATILKRKKQADSFLYSVYYPQDEATQDEIEEEDIRPGEDPSALAVQLGFPSDWKASRKGARYILTAPSGDQFNSKNAALKFIKKQEEVKQEAQEDVGDPPWRTHGHPWIGREVNWASVHKVSGTRKVTVEQVGTIEGYIKSTDVDKGGNPGFVSESTGKAADLFNVVFPDQPHHLYASFLLTSQDLEEHEVLENLLEETPAAERKREAALAAAAEAAEEEKAASTPAKASSSSPKTPKSKKRRRRS
mmetsp:Transcript_30464/g.86918  ORF Transcript_30464/g.86918 Transcript_30464/m.86918 type:complete len:374 (+) Transcript_30464:146-1267(+)